MCGLLGYSGKNINKYKFNILGLYNDSRGGDACGVFMGDGDVNQLQYGVEKHKLYSDFVANGAGANLNFNGLKFAMGHCRKASVGGVKAELAQPVVIYNADGEIEFVMIHNGTLINYIELAKKYDVNYTMLESDSQIFGRIIHKVGYKVLAEYDGAGAFIFWDSRVDKESILVFKGASQYYSNDDQIYIERPLFFLESKKGLYISSIETSLEFINDNGGTVVDITHNTLYTIKGGKVENEVFIDRSERKQLSNLVWNNKYSKNTPIVYDNGYKSEWDSYYNSRYYGDRSYRKPDYSNNTPSIISCGPTDKILDTPIGQRWNRVYFGVDGLYHFGDVLCNGIYDLSPSGYETSFDTETYYFLDGLLMKSYFHYLCAIEYCYKHLIEVDNPDVTPSANISLKEGSHWHLAKFSATPVPLKIYEEGETEFDVFFGEYNEEADETIELTGSMYPYFCFTKIEYILKDGFISSYNKYSNKNVYKKSKADEDLDKRIASGFWKEKELFMLIESEI